MNNPRLGYLHKKAAGLPMEPGVYLMKDSQKKIIYIGKAKSLKNRVSSYFRSVLSEHLGQPSLNGTITAETVENSNMVTMTVESPNAQDALNILQTALEIYPETARFVLGATQFHLIDTPEMPEAPYNQPDLVRTGGIGILAVSHSEALLERVCTGQIRLSEHSGGGEPAVLTERTEAGGKDGRIWM